MDVSIICTWRAYVSSNFDGFFFVMNLLGKFLLNRKCIALLCNCYRFLHLYKMSPNDEWEKFQIFNLINFRPILMQFFA